MKTLLYFNQVLLVSAAFYIDAKKSGDLFHRLASKLLTLESIALSVIVASMFLNIELIPYNHSSI